jgi:hypothetical protein
MAELKFDCPSCKQPIACDELWGGHQIQCPSCNNELTVPQKHGGAAPTQIVVPSSLVPKPPEEPAKLSIGRSQHQPSTTPGLSAAQATVFRKPPPPPPKGKGPLVKLGITVGILLALGAGAYFGYPAFKDWQEKRNAKSGEADTNSTATATSPASGDSSNSAPAVQEKPLPVIPAIYSLDVETAKIPEGRANGKMTGTNFVVETARIDPSGGAQVLRLFQGPLAAPDIDVLIYLHLKQGETLAGYNLKVASDTRGAGLPRVVKRVKTNPKYAPQPVSFSYGYAMKLELGQIADGAIPGKIYLALPDPEQSVVAGVFKATMTAGSTNLATAPVASPTPAAATPAASAGEKAAFDKRYGIKK